MGAWNTKNDFIVKANISIEEMDEYDMLDNVPYKYIKNLDKKHKIFVVMKNCSHNDDIFRFTFRYDIECPITGEEIECKNYRTFRLDSPFYKMLRKNDIQATPISDLPNKLDKRYVE